MPGKYIIGFLLVIFFYLLIVGFLTPKKENLPNDNTKKVPEKYIATIKTAKGDIKVELYNKVSPKTVNNFIKKSKSGFYNKKIFHRVEDWVIQGGDPLGNGTGGGNMETELSNTPFKLGSLGVARASDINVSNDSQFFICTDNCSWLTGQYTNFGGVISGMDIAKKIQVGDSILEVAIEE